ncbi:hypothetical protein V6N11_001251 [Hibiscus sabdariffa]|uniref:Uncharacterized protein n=1 Tax=Hibiscus sabdariffa TaxID=183260 RepID=A0ABR2RZ65_9ROSI
MASKRRMKMEARGYFVVKKEKGRSTTNGCPSLRVRLRAEAVAWEEEAIKATSPEADWLIPHMRISN